MCVNGVPEGIVLVDHCDFLHAPGPVDMLPVSDERIDTLISARNDTPMPSRYLLAATWRPIYPPLPPPPQYRHRSQPTVVITTVLTLAGLNPPAESPKDHHGSHPERKHTSVTGSFALHSKKRYGQNNKRVVPGCWSTGAANDTSMPTRLDPANGDVRFPSANHPSA